MLRKLLPLIFSSDKKEPAYTREKERNPVAIPIPDGIDPTAFDRIPAQMWKDDPEGAMRLMRYKKEQIFELDKRRALSAGVKAYYWRTVNDGDVCDVCRMREGKRFFYAKQPKHGHAGLCDACPDGECRCFPEPIIK